MAKAKSVYVCSECGGTALKWFGACPSCGAAATLNEQAAELRSSHRYAGAAPANAPQPLARIEARVQSFGNVGGEERPGILKIGDRQHRDDAGNQDLPA